HGHDLRLPLQQPVRRSRNLNQRNLPSRSRKRASRHYHSNPSIPIPVPTHISNPVSNPNSASPTTPTTAPVQNPIAISNPKPEQLPTRLRCDRSDTGGSRSCDSR